MGNGLLLLINRSTVHGLRYREIFSSHHLADLISGHIF